MPRPVKCRKVGTEPHIDYFKPAGVPLRNLKEVVLNVEELEALKLKDLEGMNEIGAAKKMGISQPTFNRLINSAHKKVAEALSIGYAIKIEGGIYKVTKSSN